jgi:hypothetical protein
MKTVGYLVAMTTGWADETVELYCYELTELQEPEIAYAAVRAICATENDTFRPSIGRIRSEYDAIARRRSDELQARRPALPTSKQLVSPAEGYRIAWTAYVAECNEQGREPNKEVFSSWARLAGATA